MKRYKTRYITTLIVVALIVWIIAYYARLAHSTRNVRLYMESVNSLRIFKDMFFDEENPFLADDIMSPSQEPLLSWRVDYCFNNPHYNDSEISKILKKRIDITKPWNDPHNLDASKIVSYGFPYYPYYLYTPGENKNCILRINEIHDKLKTGTLQENEKGKAYLVIVDPQYAFPWTKPQDISWKDLASGRIKLFFIGDEPITLYLTADGYVHRLNLDDLPKTEDEWREFCGVEEETH